MPLHSGKLYLLGEFSELLMDPQQVIVMFANIQDKLDTLTTIDERLRKIETCF